MQKVGNFNNYRPNIFTYKCYIQIYFLTFSLYITVNALKIIEPTPFATDTVNM